MVYAACAAGMVKISIAWNGETRGFREVPTLPDWGPWNRGAGRMRRILFITGQLAEEELRQQVRAIMKRERFTAGVLSVPVTIASLLSAKWLVKYFQKHSLPKCPGSDGTWTRICVPGWSRGDFRLLEEELGVPVVRGPKDLRELPEFFRSGAMDGQVGGQSSGKVDATDAVLPKSRNVRRVTDAEYGAYSVRLFARISHASRRSLREISELIQKYDFDRADVVVLSCDTGRAWPQLPQVIRMLRETGFRVGIDSRSHEDVDLAIRCGVHFVFGVHSEERQRILNSGILREFGLISEEWRTEEKRLAAEVSPVASDTGTGGLDAGARESVTQSRGTEGNTRDNDGNTEDTDSPFVGAVEVCTLVIVPDTAGTSQGLEDAIAQLDACGTSYMIDPGLSPVSFGFGESLGRFLALRWSHPNVELMMNLGAFMERTDGDPTGMLIVLLGFCEEQRIWAAMVSPASERMRSVLSECDHARRMFHYALWRRVLPRYLEPGLSPIRERNCYEYTPAQLDELARRLKDPNYRLFVSEGELHAVADHLHVKSKDPYLLYELLKLQGVREQDPDYAFYLGYELAKAHTAMTLHKTYRQDEALNWGLHTIPEPTRRERRHERLRLRREFGLDEEQSSNSKKSPEPESHLTPLQRREFEEYLRQDEALRRAFEDSHYGKAAESKPAATSENGEKSDGAGEMEKIEEIKEMRETAGRRKRGESRD